MVNQLPVSGFLRLPQIIGDAKRGIPAVIPVSRSTWLNWVRDGKAPSPVKLGPRTTAWRVEDIKSMIASA
ncbi:MAG TPA: AlpA family phage regulatory protein [Azonexus sp.]|nr:AlpA family phage regulatory protein [Azonexus sp.]